MLVLLALIAVVHAGTVPDYIHVCRTSDPQYDECFVESAKTLQPKLLEGIPELDVPSLDPLFIPEMMLTEPGSKLVIRGFDLKMHGVGEFVVENFRSRLSDFIFKLKLKFPKMYLEGLYELNAKLVVPLKGQGPLAWNGTDTLADVTLAGETLKKGDAEILRFKSLNLHLTFGPGQWSLEKLFHGDPLLGNAANTMLNEHYEDVMELLRPKLEKGIADLILNICNDIVGHFTTEEIFPE